MDSTDPSSEIARAKLRHLWPVAVKLVTTTFFSWAAGALLTFGIDPQGRDFGLLLVTARWILLALPFVILAVFIWNIGRSPVRVSTITGGLEIERFDATVTSLLWSDVRSASHTAPGHWWFETASDGEIGIWPGAFSKEDRARLDQVVSSNVAQSDGV